MLGFEASGMLLLKLHNVAARHPGPLFACSKSSLNHSQHTSKLPFTVDIEGPGVFQCAVPVARHTKSENNMYIYIYIWFQHTITVPPLNIMKDQ